MVLHPMGSQPQCEELGWVLCQSAAESKGNVAFPVCLGGPLGAPVGKLRQQRGLHSSPVLWGWWEHPLFLSEAECGDPLPTPWHIHSRQHPLGRRALLQHRGSALGQCHMELGLAVAPEGAAWQRRRSREQPVLLP